MRQPVIENVFENPLMVMVMSRQEGIEATPNPREWLEAMRRHLRLAVGVAGSVVAIAAYLGYTEPLLYRATSVVRLVDARRALAGGLIGGAGADVALLSANPVM